MPAGSLYAFGEQVLFSAATGEHGLEPWLSDGTPAGTRLLADLCLGPCSSVPLQGLGRWGGREYFSLQSAEPFFPPRHELWTSDGTAAGTRRVVGSEPSLDAVPAFGELPEAGLLFFWARGDLGNELWATDGSEAGTRWVSAARPLRAGAPLGGRFFFAAAEDPAGYQLFASDGNAAGTGLVAAIQPASSKVVPGPFARRGGQLFFFAHDPQHEVELFASDGTAAGTNLLSDLTPGAAGTLLVSGLAPLGDRFAFVVSRQPDGSSPELWASDGTAGGTRRLTTAALQGDSAAPYPTFPSFRAVGGRAYFVANDGAHGFEPWVTDGTEAGTFQLRDVCPGPCSSGPAFGRSFQALASGVLFDADDGVHGRERWVSDGTPQGTRMLVDFCPGACSHGTFGWQQAGAYFYFADTVSGQVWRTDGSAAGTVQLTAFAHPPFQSGFVSRAVGGRLVFVAADPQGAKSLWVTDGTPAGTVPLVSGEGPPPPPAGEWLETSAVPGFRFKVEIRSAAGAVPGRLERSCIAETLCVSGAVRGRPEVFVRVVGPKPNGFLWPNVVKFSTSEVRVWVLQTATGALRYYSLAGAYQGSDALPGLFDRTGFRPAGAASSAGSAAAGLAADPRPAVAPPPPSQSWLSSPQVPGFRFQMRVTSADGSVQPVRQEGACLAETACLSAAVPGRSELFLRVVGPKPNGYLWPTLVRFSTSTLEVWIEQRSSGTIRYYRLPGAAPGEDRLDGLFDRLGFAP